MNNRLFIALWLLMLLVSQARAVEYQLPDLDGKLQSLSQYRGKWLVVNYWASWCKTCRLEFPDLNALHEQQKDIVVIGINFESIGSDELTRFVARHIGYPVLRSEPVPLTPLGKVPALPTSYIIDPEGKIVAGQVGLVSRQHIEDYIASKTQAGAVAAN
ncbi:MAG TPA: TlpA disulfide reductase family protein [Gammaproteobacteria bacterium]